MAPKLLIGTKKGGFIATWDQGDNRYSLSDPLFAGWEIYHFKASRVDPNLIYASQSNLWFGQTVLRSTDGGANFESVSNEFTYDGGNQTHLFYDGSEVPWTFKRVWAFQPSIFERDVVFAGVEDAALFISRDLGESWSELDSLRNHGTSKSWQPGAGGMALHTIVQDPLDSDRLYVAISAAGAFRSDDAGASWTPINKGLRADYLPDEDVEVGHCVHRIAISGSNTSRLFMQKHWDVLVSDNSGDQWREISNDLPSDFGFVIGVVNQPHETPIVIPIKSDYEHFPPDGKLRVFRLETDGSWKSISNGLPQSDFYGNVLRGAMAIDGRSGKDVFFGTTTGEVFASFDAGESWSEVAHSLPSVLSVEVVGS
ncbi:MAG: sialidase family protein [Actinomycetota bacterium]|nr:sialidase family protein [Actinomycetota bacterium]